MSSNKPTYRLALSYLVVIMAMSLCFSAAIYIILSSHLNRPLPPPRSTTMPYQQPSALFEERIARRDAETRMSVLGSLAILNIVVAAGGAVLSYYLARRTLRPIETAMTAQTQFISDASHEIRTPLTVLQTSNEVALRKRKISEEKARDVFERNIIEIEKLRGLTDALLSLATTEQTDEQTRPIQLDTFLSETVARIQPLAARKKCTVTVAAPPQTITTHPVVLEQILLILLDNAIKYSPAQSDITTTGKIQNNTTVIAVHDHGIGISKKDQAHIFDRFYRADTARTRTATSGHGLGLAIAKQLADRYGYTISCSSKTGRGSVFVVETT